MEDLQQAFFERSGVKDLGSQEVWRKDIKEAVTEKQGVCLKVEGRGGEREGNKNWSFCKVPKLEDVKYLAIDGEGSGKVW